MNYIELAREIGITSGGITIFAPVASQGCYEGALDAGFYGDRGLGFTSGGMPLLGATLGCCSLLDECPRVETSQSAGILPDGVTPTMLLLIEDVSNCYSARGKHVKLEYCDPVGFTNAPCADIPACSAGPAITGCPDCDDPSFGKWTGSIALRGGTLNIEVCLSYALVGPPGDEVPQVTATLRYWGCGTDPDWDAGCATVTQDCYDPLIFTFSNIDLPYCCDCVNTVSADTGTVTFLLAANCKLVAKARHIDIDIDGTPVFAVENCKAIPPDIGCLPTCPLNATITDVSGCSCLAGSYGLVYQGGETWDVAVGSGTPCSGTLEVTCTNNADGTSTVSATITCGATNTGTASVTVPYADLEDFDETFTIDMDDPAAGDCTDCVYEYNEMAGSWSNLSGCSGTDCGACGETPSDPPASPTDGQQVTRPCPTGGSAPCCIGQVTVRVMR